ncbi:MAG: mevalonate kinase [Flavobacteriales bacterium CG_4_9_14_0_2_um_filter_35_242]|nr:mevalonate kinase [Zetaproteobacteria bacterium]OIO12161.1 MAG: mevalonate kinase [Flavobacteriaceae bacterium CG1_02_35_72]PIR14671.1 MAG: mevalonate kinase [Flavobacteriales bacterium CG11_big_fil_rev_8_21_14_0_20_35_7]PIV16954.1 MAG: mevalonate kinase [Flavobacteriales bacterium CG03_land_8_20_14_0_80_35_15]PJA04788.1 MAG: mevalonate kinase [Flavobacteriales bacterium CG_4_10_14_0_2_um_filter_35_18]PJC58067.1 MAG: mevalonate kinase [Flavobacteriales bacterium CG_4_9_14_0_2_um_filter_35_2
MKGPLFYAKILLFGEYGIIKDSKGLAIPYNTYQGALKKSNTYTEEAKLSHANLNKFYDYLMQLEANDNAQFDLDAFKSDLNEGMYFDSSIPQGYGVGSSGALVAAIYDKYAKNKITVLENLTRDKLLSLKATFSKMESFFHGKSSGLDPLNSYLSIPILINSKDDLETTGIPSQKPGKGAVFLLDSKMVGETAPMVSIFMNKMKQKGFRKMIDEDFAKLTDACIDHFLKAEMNALFGDVKQLSKIVLKNFKPMIPKAFHKLWEQGIATNDYYLKLCGSGGGGYILGFTKDYEKTKMILKDYDLELVYRF